MFKTMIQFMVAFLMSFGMQFAFHMAKFPQPWSTCMIGSLGIVMLITNKLEDLDTLYSSL